MSYSNVFLLLKKKYSCEWKSYTEHDFIKKLSHNNLSEKNFLNYLIQDYLFLIQFSKAWSLAIIKSDNLKEMKVCANTVNGLINFEMDLHIKLCKKYGIQKKELDKAEEKNKNIAYSRFVLESGFSGDFLDLITALMPCVLGYAEIGNNIKNYKPSNQMYKTWIQTYSGEEYQEISKSVGKLFDSAVLGRLGNNFKKTHKWKKIQKKFKTAILLEIDFWEMALEYN